MSNSKKTIYLLDTNTLIGFSLWIPIPLNAFFWNRMEESLRNGDWVLLDVIADEVKHGELKKWCKKQVTAGLVTAINDDHRNRAADINDAYPMIDTTTMNSAADTYLLAYAEENGLTIFTREGSRISRTDRYKIPDVCVELKMNYIKQPSVFLGAIGYSN